MRSRVTFAVGLGLAALYSVSAIAADLSYYRKKSTWRETLLVSLMEKENPGSSSSYKRTTPRTTTRTTTKPSTRTTTPRATPGVWKDVTSGPVKGRQRAKKLTANVKGQEYLVLVVNDGGDGTGNDHAVWANAKLKTSRGMTVWLDTLKPESAEVGWGKFFAGRRGINVGANRFMRHVAAHANSVIVYKLDPAKNYISFEAYVGLDRKARGKGSVSFTITNKKQAAAAPTPTQPKARRSNKRQPAAAKVNLGPLWQRLIKDFPRDTNQIWVAYDWCRQEKISIESRDAEFRSHAERAIGNAGKAIEYVSKKNRDPKLAAEYSALRSRLAKGKENREVYLDAHVLRRKAIVSHPDVDFDQILVNRNPPTMYSHNGDQHLGRHSRVGPGLTMLTNWKDGNPQVKTIFAGKLPAGATRNPDLHYDAKKVAFGFCDHTRSGQKRYFLYEGTIDGRSVRQITGTARDRFQTWDGRATVMIEDGDPCYLPDDDIVFISTRGQTYGRCHGGRYNPAWILFRCKADGSAIQQLSFANENEYEPSVLNDGRIVFTRWEYTNRHEMLFHMLWWCRPDGTAVTHFYGNDTLHPMMVTETTHIPGTHKVVATAMGHHSYSTGTTVILDTNKGENGEGPVTHITPETPYSETRGWPEPHYSHPYAINEELFLVSRANHKVHKQGQRPPPANRAIYLVDPTGGRELIYEDPQCATFSPIAIRPRKRPPVLPSMVAEKPPDYGTVFLQNAYLTRNDPQGIIKPGMIKGIRVIALGVQPRARRTPCNMKVRVEIPKKVIGTVPINENGSAFFKVPARTSLQIQTIDKNGMAILTEKSLFYLQPGENRSCIGCHEPVGTSPVRGAIARNNPVDLKPAAGPQYEGGLSFMRTVQPVLDRYCIKCHGLEKTNKGVNLVHDGKISWPRPYVALFSRGDHRVGDKGYMGGERNISRPRRFFAYSNKVAHMLVANHSKVNMDRESYMRIIEWMDVNAQCYGDLFPNKIEERKIDNGGMQAIRSYAKQLFGGKIASQPDRALINVAQPDESRILMMPLKKSEGGWGQIEGYKSKTDPKYKKMAMLVNKAIVRSRNENVKGWTPDLECGGGEDWVMRERKQYRSNAPR